MKKQSQHLQSALDEAELLAVLSFLSLLSFNEAKLLMFADSEKHGFAVWSLARSWDHQANRKGEKLSVAEHRAEAAEEQAENIRKSKLSMTFDDFR